MKLTIGYGHHPLLTVMWARGIVLVRWGIVKAAARANLVRRAALNQRAAQRAKSVGR
jgi:hypothetical protein